MKITCERCSAQYDLDEKRIPPSGMSMKCPACLHTFLVRKGGPALVPPPPPPEASGPPSRKKEIALSTFEAEEGPTVLPPAAPGMELLEDDGIDLPAPKEMSPDRARTPTPRPGTPRPPISLPTHDGFGEATRDDGGHLAHEGGPVLDEIDLPAPVSQSRHDIVDLPAPKSQAPASPRAIALADENIDLADLPAPKERGGGHQVGISLDAPDPEDLAGSAMPLELDDLDVVAPKGPSRGPAAHDLETMDVAPREPDLLAPRGDPMELAPREPGAASEAPVPRRPAVKPAAGAPEPAAAAAPAATPPTGRRWTRLAAVAGGLLLLLGGVGVALGVFTDVGQRLLRGGASPAVEQQLMAARKQLGDDTLGAYRKAAQALQPLYETDDKAFEALALAAQARLAMARLGVAAELRTADGLLAKIVDEKAQALPEVQKARALRAVVGNQYPDARKKLTALLQKAPADATALVYLGWAELGAGDAGAAGAAFGKALAAEGTRAQALYGAGVAKERLGDATAARDLYQRALARSPQHFGAAVGLARTSKPPVEAQAEVHKLIESRGAAAAPKELADAWTTLGLLADQQGRHEEAEDRLKRALALDPDLAPARVALARVECDLGHAAEAVTMLDKLIAAQPKNLDARLVLGRAQLETGDLPAAATSLQAAAGLQPKSAQVLYWQARLQLAQAKPLPNGTNAVADREAALAKLKDAIGADPKLIPAYVLQSTTMGQLGHDEDAVAALQAAEKQAADDPELMQQLGQAYLALGKPAEAEKRFRAALEKKPDARASRMALGAALEAENKLDDAKAQYEQVQKEDAKYPGVTERLARLALKQGHKAEAVQLFDAALKEGVPTASLKLAAAQLYLDPTVDRREDARKLAESVVTDDDRSAQAHLIVARAALEGGHPDEALPEARRAAMLADLPEAHLVLGKVLESVNKLDQAITEYGQARRPPVEGEAALGRARILVRMGATKDALSELAALAKDPKLKAPALLLTGDCYADLQQPDRARHAYEDAARAAPDSGDAAFKLGRALHDAGRRHDSIAQLERALKLGGVAATWAAEANLLLGDAHREGKENEAAVKAYKRYLELAPPSAPERSEVLRHISLLGGG